MNQKNWQKIKANPDLIHQYDVRSRVIDSIRKFFKNEEFREVETPLLVKSPGTEPYLEVFESTLKRANLEDQKAYLLTSPEYSMKKLLAAGLGSIFQICKSFRNGEGISGRHNPEFTILEWYRVNADYRDVMDDFEKMMLAILHGTKSKDKKTVGKNELLFQGKIYDLTPPYPRISVAEAFEKYVGVSKDELLSRDSLMAVAKEKDYQLGEETTWEEVYNQLFLNEIESEIGKINKPVIIYDYPASQAALSRKKADDPRFAERFEVYMAGLELGNAFSELTDAKEQKERLEEELALREKLGKTKYELDNDFIDALSSGLPDTGGIAVGVDRLVMLFANVATIEETLFFPGSEVF